MREILIPMPDGRQLLRLYETDPRRVAAEETLEFYGSLSGGGAGERLFYYVIGDNLEDYRQAVES